MIAIIANKFGRITCKRLSEQSDIKLIKTHVLTKQFRTQDFTNVTGVIRFGTIKTLPGSFAEVNNISAISKAIDKIKTRTILQEHEIRTPKTWQVSEVEDINSLPLPLIAQPRFHFGGNGLEFIDTIESINNYINNHDCSNSYFSEYINKKRELRVFVTHGMCLTVFEKIPPENTNCTVWNRHISNCKFVPIRQNEWPKFTVKKCIKAVEVLGLDFGAVDVMIGRENTPKYYILEINTSPGLTGTYSQTKMASYFKWLKNYFNEHNSFPPHKNTEMAERISDIVFKENT
jgi:glutathione synthase/RimK-type ligase-like ATP-grasp enzyme